MIVVENLTKRFGRFTAVRNLSFRVGEGEALVLWGPNGAGKTTVIRCLLGLLRCEGRITVAGHDIRTAGKSARRALGYVPQELAYQDDFRLVETLRFFARLRGDPTTRAERVLAEVGLAEHRQKRIRELSGGMKQRLALALALLSDPPLLVLDELTSNLDAAAQSGFVALLRDLKKKGKTILFTSHRLDEVEALADRVLMLEAGCLRAECLPSELPALADLRCLLRIFVAEDLLEAAVGTLKESGFAASRNGRSLFVEVPSHAKAAPLHALARAEIEVRNFDMTGDAPRSPRKEG